MAYDKTVPNEANIVRTASGDLAKMRENFTVLSQVASGVVSGGTALAGFILGDTTNGTRFKVEVSSTLMKVWRNVGSEGSPSWQAMMTFNQATGQPLESSYNIYQSNAPTAGQHLTNKTYVDALTYTLSGLTDTDVPSPSSGDYLAWNGTDWAVRNTTLQELTDTTIASPVSGQSLIWDGLTWANASGEAGAQTLSGLTDTVITAPTSGQMLEWDGTDWVNTAAPAGTLSGLTDTNITAPVDGAVLVWNDGASEWRDGAAPAQTLSGLTDTDISGPTSGQHLTWNGTDWANTDMPSGNRVIAVLSGSQTQSIPQSTVTVMSGNEVPFNQGGFTVNSGTITIPDGISRVDIIGQVNWASAGVGQSYDAELYLGSSPLSGISSYLLTAKDRRRKSTDTDTSHQQAVAYDVPVASGDTITLRVLQTGSAGGLNITAGTGLLVRESTNGGAAGGGGGVTTLAALTDTSISSPTSGQVLEWDGSDWANVAITEVSGLDTAIAGAAGLVESFDLLVEEVTSGDSYTVSLYAFYTYDVDTLRGKTSNGTCDLNVKIDSTVITGLSGITVSGTETGWDSSAGDSVAVGETLTIDVVDATSCSGLAISMKTTRT